MSSAEQIAGDVLDRVQDNPDLLREVVDRLDMSLSAGALEHTQRLWGISTADLGRMFGVSRQAMSKWLSHGPPGGRRAQVELLGQITSQLDRWLKRERIPAVVRRPVTMLGDRTRLDVALAGELELLREEIADTFDLTRVAA